MLPIHQIPIYEKEKNRAEPSGSESKLMKKPLGIGFIGSGFITRFHIQSFIGVRNADVLGVWSPNRQNAESAAALAREIRVGDCQAFPTIEEMVASPDIDAIWLCGPNHKRV